MKSLEILDFSVLQILAAAFSIVFFVGRKTVKDEFKKLQEQTKALIRDAFKATSSDEREDFYKSLKDRGLIDGHPGEWKVKE